MKAWWSFGLFAVHFRNSDSHSFGAMTVRGYVKVDDVFDSCVPGLSVAVQAVMSDVVCTG